MQRNRIIRLTVAVAAIIISFAGVQNTKAQVNESSSMVYSPYTMYGIGDLIKQGTASSMAMGGVGLGMRSSFEINYLNPASLSALKQQNALFSFGARGNNYYSKTPHEKNTYNTFDISDLGFAVPLYRGIGMSLSMTPVSAVGYNSTIVDSDSQVMEDVGRAVYKYVGSGGISQVSMGIGVMIVRGFSVGANLNYYFGNIDRQHSATIVPLLGQTTKYRSLISTSNMHVSGIGFGIGAQYSHRVGRNSGLTLGVTYQPDRTFQVDRKDETLLIYQGAVDTLKYGKYDFPVKIPQKLAIGLHYSGQKITAGFDWSHQDWKNAFELKTSQAVSMKANTDYRFGISYCPDRTNLSSAFKRFTYKAGFHYTQLYLVKDNIQLSDIGFTVGMDFPLRKSDTASKLTIGVDFGKRGTYKAGQVQDNYFKIYAGLTLFARDNPDFWFLKEKFQ